MTELFFSIGNAVPPSGVLPSAPPASPLSGGSNFGELLHRIASDAQQSGLSRPSSPVSRSSAALPSTPFSTQMSDTVLHSEAEHIAALLQRLSTGNNTPTQTHSDAKIQTLITDITAAWQAAEKGMVMPSAAVDNDAPADGDAEAVLSQLYDVLSALAALIVPGAVASVAEPVGSSTNDPLLPVESALPNSALPVSPTPLSLTGEVYSSDYFGEIPLGKVDNVGILTDSSAHIDNGSGLSFDKRVELSGSEAENVEMERGIPDARKESDTSLAPSEPVRAARTQTDIQGGDAPQRRMPPVVQLSEIPAQTADGEAADAEFALEIERPAQESPIPAAHLSHNFPLSRESHALTGSAVIVPSVASNSTNSVRSAAARESMAATLPIASGIRAELPGLGVVTVQFRPVDGLLQAEVLLPETVSAVPMQDVLPLLAEGLANEFGISTEKTGGTVIPRQVISAGIAEQTAGESIPTATVSPAMVGILSEKNSMAVADVPAAGEEVPLVQEPRRVHTQHSDGIVASVIPTHEQVTLPQVREIGRSKVIVDTTEEQSAVPLRPALPTVNAESPIRMVQYPTQEAKPSPLQPVVISSSPMPEVASIAFFVSVPEVGTTSSAQFPELQSQYTVGESAPVGSVYPQTAVDETIAVPAEAKETTARARSTVQDVMPLISVNVIREQGAVQFVVQDKKSEPAVPLVVSVPLQTSVSASGEPERNTVAEAHKKASISSEQSVDNSHLFAQDSLVLSDTKPESSAPEVHELSGRVQHTVAASGSDVARVGTIPTVRPEDGLRHPNSGKFVGASLPDEKPLVDTGFAEPSAVEAQRGGEFVPVSAMEDIGTVYTKFPAVMPQRETPQRVADTAPVLTVSSPPVHNELQKPARLDAPVVAQQSLHIPASSREISSQERESTEVIKGAQSHSVSVASTEQAPIIPNADPILAVAQKEPKANFGQDVGHWQPIAHTEVLREHAKDTPFFAGVPVSAVAQPVTDSHVLPSRNPVIPTLSQETVGSAVQEPLDNAFTPVAERVDKRVSVVSVDAGATAATHYATPAETLSSTPTTKSANAVQSSLIETGEGIGAGSKELQGESVHSTRPEQTVHSTPITRKETARVDLPPFVDSSKHTAHSVHTEQKIQSEPVAIADSTLPAESPERAEFHSPQAAGDQPYLSESLPSREVLTANDRRVEKYTSAASGAPQIMPDDTGTPIEVDSEKVHFEPERSSKNDAEPVSVKHTQSKSVRAEPVRSLESDTNTLQHNATEKKVVAPQSPAGAAVFAHTSQQTTVATTPHASSARVESYGNAVEQPASTHAEQSLTESDEQSVLPTARVEQQSATVEVTPASAAAKHNSVAPLHTTNEVVNTQLLEHLPLTKAEQVATPDVPLVSGERQQSIVEGWTMPDAEQSANTVQPEPEHAVDRQTESAQKGRAIPQVSSDVAAKSVETREPLRQAESIPNAEPVRKPEPVFAPEHVHKTELKSVSSSEQTSLRRESFLPNAAAEPVVEDQSRFIPVVEKETPMRSAEQTVRTGKVIPIVERVYENIRTTAGRLAQRSAEPYIAPSAAASTIAIPAVQPSGSSSQQEQHNNEQPLARMPLLWNSDSTSEPALSRSAQQFSVEPQAQVPGVPASSTQEREVLVAPEMRTLYAPLHPNRPAVTPVRSYKQVVPSDIPRTVQSAMRTLPSGGGVVQMTLAPEALGEVLVSISVKDKQTEVAIHTETPDARKLVEAQLPALREKLVQTGLQVEHIEVRSKQQDIVQNDPRSWKQGGQTQEEQKSRQEFVKSFRHLASDEQREQTASRQRTGNGYFERYA